MIIQRSEFKTFQSNSKFVPINSTHQSICTKICKLEYCVGSLKGKNLQQVFPEFHNHPATHPFYFKVSYSFGSSQISISHNLELNQRPFELQKFTAQSTTTPSIPLFTRYLTLRIRTRVFFLQQVHVVKAPDKRPHNCPLQNHLGAINQSDFLLTPWSTMRAS